MQELWTKWPNRVLAPIERVSEILCGLIMALTFTSALGIALAERTQIRTMLIGALGCNLAWGIIDAGMYLMARVNERHRNMLMLRVARRAPDLATARRIIADALPPLLASLLTPEQSEYLWQELRRMPEPPSQLGLSRRDGVGALAVGLLVFMSTLPVVIPFVVIGDARWALRVSNAVAIAMMFLCGHAFGRSAGLHPWTMGLSMIAVGGVLAGVAVALGG